jgi:NAD(P)-dependent dehydrogenase (short-subunit alcohol dehydrogenase family)
MELFELKNKSVLITGSSRGIGKSIAWQCAKAGAKVIISSRKYDVCEATTKEINDDIGLDVAFPIACNISDKDQLANLVIQTKELIGQIDVLVCNAASNPHMGSSLEISEEAFDKIINNNIKSNHLLCNLVLPEMIERKDGVIIIISSIGGFRGNSIIGTYAMTKAADMALARNLAVEFGHYNIRANTIAPGLIKTDMAKALWENPDILKSVTATNPMRRIGEPDEIGGIAVMLASKAGTYINGQTIVADGGSTISG